jgi:hypothetical protein
MTASRSRNVLLFLLCVRSRVVRHITNGRGDMRDARPQAGKITVRTGKDGSISSDIGPGGYRGGFSQLLDLNAPVFSPRSLPPQETTKVGFVRTGSALAGALAKARERFGN